MFRTEISHIHGRFGIDHKTKLLSLGSCFAENIGNRLSENKFDIETNPAGIIFNPLSLFELLELTMDSKPVESAAYLEQQGIFLNYKFHSSVNGKSLEEVNEQVGQHLQGLKSRLLQTDTLILTFGTAWIYQLKSVDMLVANCHKVPQDQFHKKLLEVNEITAAFGALKTEFDTINPDLKIILTVSPIRHTKEGLSNNNLSKSVLRLACHELFDRFEQVDYFPAYEILMDDLRDYRFYEKDLIHPNEQAQDYIWSKFAAAYFDEQTRNLIAQWSDLLNALKHRPFHTKSDQHQKFLQSTLVKLENLNGTIDVSEEINQVKTQLL